MLDKIKLKLQNSPFLSGISDAGWADNKKDYLIEYYRYVDLEEEDILFIFTNIKHIVHTTGENIFKLECETMKKYKIDSE